MGYSSVLGQPSKKSSNIGLEFLKKREEIMIKIKQNLTVAQQIQNIYANKSRTIKELNVGEHAFLKVEPKKKLLKLGSCTTLAARLCGPFEI